MKVRAYFSESQKFTFPIAVSLFVLSVSVVYSDREKSEIRNFLAKLGVARVYEGLNPSEEHNKQQQQLKTIKR